MMHQVAVIQMCSSTVVEENLNSAELLVKQAAEQGAVLAVLPEMFVLFGAHDQDRVKIGEQAGTGMMQDRLADIAKKYNIWLVAGTIPMACANPNKIRAACIVFDNQGKQVARYDKINLFDVTLSETEAYKESDTAEPGHDIVVIDTPVGRLGLCVCFDLRFPNIFSAFSAQGVELIAVPAAFTVKTGEAHWELLCRSRAIDTFSYVLAAGQGGTHANGRRTQGHSMIVDPWGKVVSECTQAGNQVILAQVDLDYVYEVRKTIPTRNSLSRMLIPR